MLNLLEIHPGQRVSLKNGAVCEVIENIGDGIWLTLRTLSHPTQPQAVGEEELVHCEEMVDLIETQ